MTVLVVGVGPVGVEYARVLRAMGQDIIAIGRSAERCAEFEQQTQIPARPGGLAEQLGRLSAITHAIVAVSEGQLTAVSGMLIHAGIPKILVEKPGATSGSDLQQLAKAATDKASSVVIGYNRRFHNATLQARRMIDEDGGVVSFNFEFTEWSHRIEPIAKEPGIKEQWFIHNSSHVIDLAFHLGGWPRDLCAYSSGSLSWHPRARFAGAGVSTFGATFSYSADWQAPGRWGVEVATRKRRFIFRPLEQLHVQKLGSIEVEKIALQDDQDTQYKPGFFKQVQGFLENSPDLLTLSQQAANNAVFETILWGNRH